MNLKNNVSTVDKTDQKNFDKIGDQWWDLDGPMKPLHDFNNIRIKFIKKVLEKHNFNSYKPFEKLNILDIGCGGGILTEPMARLGGNVTGLDSNQNAIKIAKKHAKKSSLRISYFSDNIQKFKPKNQYDVITCMEVVEHVTNLENFISEAKKYLKPNGFFIGSTINKSVSSFLLAIVTAEYIFNLLPKNTHQWQKFVTPKKLSEIFLRNNLLEFKFKGVIYNPFLRQWNFTNFNKVNYLFSVRKLK